MFMANLNEMGRNGSLPVSVQYSTAVDSWKAQVFPTDLAAARFEWLLPECKLNGLWVPTEY
jgi:hypothetical protein